MAKTSALNNLRDMIAIIGSFNLLKDFIKLHAPSLKINWGGVCRMKNIDRADSIVDAMDFCKGQVCIASMGKVKKLCIEVISSENTTIAVVFYRALRFEGI